MAWCLAATMLGDDAPAGAALDFPGIDQADYDTCWVARFVSARERRRGHRRGAVRAAAADGLLPDCLLTLAGSTIATLRSRSD
ncbi:hypothetical protein V2I01_14885 [Micromonospora sp. BRA006-A]|nr:hypothetical protein [Micromonospora sp. BRA006-A]